MKKRIMSLLLASLLGVSALFGSSMIAAADDEDEDLTNLVVTLLTFTPMSEEVTAHVEEHLNEITKEKINCTVDFQWLDTGAYLTSVPMMLQANEQLDLVMFTPIPSASYQSFMSQGQLMDITDLLPEYAPDVVDILGDYLKATSKEGKIYGVGNLMCLQTKMAIDMRKDVLEQAGVLEQAQNLTNWQQAKEVLKAGVDATGMTGLVSLDAEGSVVTMPPFVVGKGEFSDAQWLDCCGDSYYFTYVDPADDKVKCYFENEKWIETEELAREFYNEGLIYKDALTSQNTGVTLIKGDVGFAQVSPSELGGDVQFKNSTGYECLSAPIVTCEVATAAFQKFGYAVPVTSAYPEEALELLNLMWTDKEFADTLAWGVQGVDWIVNDRGMADYPEGVDQSSAYHMQDFMFGNTLEITPWDGPDADIRQHSYEANDNLKVSKYFGFSIDPTNVADKIVAVKTVYDKTVPGLNSGTAGDDVRGIVEKYIESIYAVGMQDIIDEYQRQLDAWLAEQ